MRNSVVLLSGGFDSAVLLCQLMLKAEDGDRIIPVYVRYGNKNERKEVASASHLVTYLQNWQEGRDVDMELSNLLTPSMCGAGSPITNGKEHKCGEAFPAEYVPYRNSLLVLTALSAVHTSWRLVEAMSIRNVYLATNKDDILLKFPDCGTIFQNTMQLLLNLYANEKDGNFATEVLLPFSTFTKANISELYKKIRKNHQDLPDLTATVFSGYTDGDPSPALKASQERHSQPCPVLDAREVEKDMAQIADDRKETIRAVMQEQPSTSLMVKEHEPLIIRKFTQYGFPLYVGLICGANLDTLDSVVHGFLQPQKERIQKGGIQNMRNIVGELSEKITETYGLKIEGVAVVWYVDKMMVSSLYGDFMTHTSCRIEFYSLLQMSCHV